MGQKIHPYGLRLGIITDWKSRWYSDKDYAPQVIEDAAIRKTLTDELTRGAVSRIEIERVLTLSTAVVPAASYREFAEFCRAVDEALAGRITLERER